jgi:hypothetical protein
MDSAGDTTICGTTSSTDHDFLKWTFTSGKTHFQLQFQGDIQITITVGDAEAGTDGGTIVVKPGGSFSLPAANSAVPWYLDVLSLSDSGTTDYRVTFNEY